MGTKFVREEFSCRALDPKVMMTRAHIIKDRFGRLDEEAKVTYVSFNQPAGECHSYAEIKQRVAERQGYDVENRH